MFGCQFCILYYYISSNVDTSHFRLNSSVNKKKTTNYPIGGRPLLSDGGLTPNTGVTCPDIELFPKLTLDLPRLLPPMFLVKFKFAMAIW